MKKVILFFLTLCIGSFGMSASSTLEVSWKFSHIADGYDHLNKIEVYVDDLLMSTSESFHQSELGKHTIIVPKGEHLVTIRNFAYYDGNWEEHLVKKGYSIDAQFSEKYNLKKKNYLTLVWDLDKPAEEALTYLWSKPTSKILMEPEPNKSGIKLDVTWKFLNVNLGFDHDVRMVVYADGKEVFTSKIAKGSVGNTFAAILPKGTKEIKIVGEAFYEGGWEAHLISNSYSMDAIVLKTTDILAKMTLDVKFDLKQSTVNAVWN